MFFWLFVIFGALFVYFTRKTKAPSVTRRFHGENLEASGYDYIVVGSGSAGSTLTAKLVQEAKRADGSPATVLLLEVCWEFS
jgi:hypothetical protein